jgi:hypothetical protein
MYALLVEYQLKGNQTDWERTVKDFVSKVGADSDLRGRFTYRVMEGEEDASKKTHLITFLDDDVGELVQGKPFTAPFQKKIEEFSGGETQVTSLNIIARSDA